MRTGRLHARLDRLAPTVRRGRIVVIFLESWSAAAQVAYDAACLAGDTGRQAAIISQETSEVVDLTDGSVITVIEIRERVDGPA